MIEYTLLRVSLDWFVILSDLTDGRMRQMTEEGERCWDGKVFNRLGSSLPD